MLLICALPGSRLLDSNRAATVERVTPNKQHWLAYSSNARVNVSTDSTTDTGLGKDRKVQIESFDSYSELDDQLSISRLSFPLDDSYSLPFQGTLMTSSLQTVEWPKTLKNFLQHLQSPHDPVVLVVADNSFKPVLINWLIFSQLNLNPPLKNVLIVTNDDELCLFLAGKKLNNCLSVPLSTLLQGPVLNSLTHMFNQKRSRITQLCLIRTSVMRILNRWGFDVANFDSDAIILRNPLPLLREYPGADIVGTFGGGLPQPLRIEWGLVLCMGAIVVRSTSATGDKQSRIYMHYNYSLV